MSLVVISPSFCLQSPFFKFSQVVDRRSYTICKCQKEDNECDTLISRKCNDGQKLVYIVLILGRQRLHFHLRATPQVLTANANPQESYESTTIVRCNQLMRCNKAPAFTPFTKLGSCIPRRKDRWEIIKNYYCTTQVVSIEPYQYEICKRLELGHFYQCNVVPILLEN